MTADTIIEDCVFTIDFGQSLEDMIATGKYDSANADITAKHFPVEGVGIQKFRSKLFHFNRYISSKAAVAAIKKEGFEPATHVHGLAFGATFPDEQRKYPIACLGSSARVVRVRRFVCLYRLDAERLLDLFRWSDYWSDYGRVLGVQEVSAT
jgi:hypothetical protein